MLDAKAKVEIGANVITGQHGAKHKSANERSNWVIIPCGKENMMQHRGDIDQE